MKIKTLAGLSLVAAAVCGTSVMAQGHVVFQGTVSAGTCSSKINGQGSGALQVSEFSTSGAGLVPGSGVTFTIDLDGCNPGVKPYARFYAFGSTPLSSVYPGLFANRASVPAPAQGFDLRLHVNHSSGALAAGSASSAQAASEPRYDYDPIVTADASGHAKLTYRGGYIRHPAPAQVTAGAFYTEVGYVINYD